VKAKAKKLKYFLVVICTLGFVLYVSLVPMESDYFRFIRFKKDDDSANADDEFDGNSSYFVSTSGCKMPSFPIMNDDIRTYMETVKPIECKPSLTVGDEKSIWINLEVREIHKYYEVEEPESIKCFYQSFRRKSDRLVDYNETRVAFGYGKIVPINDEFIKVECFEGNQTIADDLLCH
jgi:hypothetical protein